MRVTETRMIELARSGVEKARERANEAAQRVSSGLRVEKPSQDRSAWTEAMRDRARQILSESRGSAIARSTGRLMESDRALAEIGENLVHARELAVGMANGTHSAEDRAAAALEVRQMLANVGAQLQARDSFGEPLFGQDENAISSGEGQTQLISIDGRRFDNNLLAQLEELAVALETNDPSRIDIGALQGVADQVNQARALAGTRLDALDQADAARSALELHIEERRADLIGADPVAAATELARARGALETARASATALIQIVQGG